MSGSFVAAFSSKSIINVIQMLMREDVSDHEKSERWEHAD
jgi:hypothetical protein